MSSTSFSSNMPHVENKASFDFASESADSKGFLSKKVLPVVRKIGNAAGKVANVSGKVATIAALL